MTLIAGSALGGVASLFGARPVQTQPNAAVLRARNSRRGCAYRRADSYAQSTNVIPISEPNTKYTQEAWDHGVTGVVRLRVTFDAGGYISNVETVDGLPYGLTEEAKKVAWQKKFIPATVDGQPVTVTQDVDYVFSLSDRMAAGL